MGGKKATIGYQYFMGVHFGICHGPIDALTAIRVGDRLAWSGSATTSQTFQIDNPNLFGGKKKEGGIVGPFSLMMGEPTQMPNSYLASKQGGLQPAYRGLCTAVYRGLIASMNPYPKPWAFRVQRVLRGWYNDYVWYPEKAVISMDGGQIYAMNAAHMFYQTITDPEWGMGYPESSIDLDVLEQTADILYDEGFGLCLKWNKTDSIESWLQILANHVGGIVSTDRNTGKFRFDLIRDNYDLDDLPVFDKSNILEVTEFEPPGLEDTTNEITISYKDPVSGNKGAITLQSLASVQAQGRVVSEKRDYPGLPTGELAARVGVRDLRASSTGLKRVSLKLNRTAYALRPGQVFRFIWEQDGLNLIMRAGQVSYGSLRDGTISVVALEDVFGLPASTYVGIENPSWTEPPTNAQDMTVAKVVEASYLDLARLLPDADFSAVEEAGGRVLALGREPTGLSLNFGLYTRTGSAQFAEEAVGDFCPVGFTTTQIVQEEETTVVLQDVSSEDLIEVGTLCYLGDELVLLSSWNSSTSTAVLKRGCGDTVPVPHAAGTGLYVYSELNGLATIEYAAGELVDVKLITRTSQDELAQSNATTRYVTMNYRFDRPFPPGRLRVNGLEYPDEVDENPIVLTFAHRSRVSQHDQIVDTSQTSIGPEEGTLYKVEVLNPFGAVVRTEYFSDPSWTYTTRKAVLDSLLTDVRFKISSVRDGLESWQKYDISLDRTAPVDDDQGTDVGPIVITTTSLPVADKDKLYSVQLIATGGHVHKYWNVVSGNVPGITLTSDGILNGIPTTEGTYSLTVRASGPVGVEDTQVLSLKVEGTVVIIDGGGA